MSWPARMFGSSLGSKYIMAITGLFLFGFLVAHLAGNLLVFAGPEALNNYAVGLRELPYGALWIARIGLLVIFLVHIAVALKLSAHNRNARPVAYASRRDFQRASWPSRYMVLTGLLILAYVLFHLAHFTVHVVPGTVTALDPAGRADVYGMVIHGFQQPLISVTYIVAMMILGLHLHHGLSSMFQSVGINNPRWNPLLGMIGPVVGWAIAIGYISIPVAIWLGFVS